MIAKADIDVVDICVPTPFHCDYVIAALNAGKHVFCEKPICRDFEQLEKMKAALAARKPGQFFNVGMCVRAWPEYADAKKRIDAGELGKLSSATFRRLSPSVVGNGWKDWYLNDEISGGALLEMHLHDTDFICHLFGVPQSVNSFGVKGVISDKAVDHIVTNYNYGRVGVTLKKGYEHPLPKVGEMVEQRVTVASERLDCVVSALIGVSRNKATEKIEQSLVTLNSVVTEKVTAKVTDGDVISVRSKGKFFIESLQDKTKKDRLILKYKKYV